MKHLFITALLLATVSLSVRGQSQLNGDLRVHTGGHYGVAGAMTFKTGHIITPRATPNDNVLFIAGASAASASNASHVNGYVEKAGATDFTFPIGDGTSLRTAGISGLTAATNVQAAYIAGDAGTTALAATGQTYATSNLGTGVSAVSKKEYWDINGSAAVKLTLSWNAASDLNTLAGGSVSNLVIVGYNASTSKWESLGNAGGTTGTLSGDGTITATNVTPNSYTAYTFGTKVAGTVDLTPSVLANSLNFNKGGSQNFTASIDNIGSAAAAAPVVFSITKLNPTFTVAINASATSVGGTAVNNADWDIVEGTNSFTLTLKSGKSIAASSSSVVGFTITASGSASSNSKASLTTTIGTYTGESSSTNNRDNQKLLVN